MHQYRITVIMPALNEEKCLDAAIENVLRGFEDRAVEGELLIINDGSRDRTGQMAEGWAAKFPFVRVVHHESPQGIGASFWDGVLAARGEIVAFVPGDGENDASEIFRYLGLMDEVDIVVPFVYNPGVRPLSRRLLSFTYHQIIYLTTALSLNYLNGTVMYRKVILEGLSIKSRGFFYQTELLLKTIGRDYLYAEVPYALKKRRSGRSKAVSLKSLVEVARSYLATMRDIYPLIRSGRHVPAAGSATARRLAELESQGASR